MVLTPKVKRKPIPLRLERVRVIAFLSVLSNQTNCMVMDVAGKVKSIIVEKLGVEESAVVPTASFTNDLGADSLDTVELIMDFEKEFNITIPDDDAEKIGTVGDAIQYIEQHSGK